ncbi:hypothetical protein CSC70_05815 [Pseudoxanthomonas kalamensis DSM 18571]|uniref:hypothetical protein n=1 Tax=Pseudoxanthomonas kalamensis TaxID=289483 RepID=UPI0013915B33|nr:hypothetical protein [Pseudoxanthomonas kalamensis]KAF1711420.1 hypothetical protein CSC70_05815 [Pseudoxanthomonas kalamensis DSM 18571]
MSAPPPLPAPHANAMPPSRDAADLRTLSILFHVYNALQLLGVLLIGGLLALGIGIERSKNLTGQTSEQAIGGQILIGILTVVIVLSLVMLVLKFIVARDLARHRRHGLCLAVSILICLDLPLGTALGIYALVVLNRPSVKALFGTR